MTRSISAIERANDNGFLWPPIADAVDTFLRRRLNQADPYEKLWRLIHVWEAIDITLANTALAKVVSDMPNTAFLRRLREFFYGMTWDEIDRSFSRIQGAGEGSIDQWINMLEEIAKQEDLPAGYLQALNEFLNSDGIDLSEVAQHWSRACDIPPEAKRSEIYAVRHAMRHINSLRNRLAHVPFPHDPLEDLADALEGATEALFQMEPLPSAHAREGRSSPLTGAIQYGRSRLHGGQLSLMDEQDGGSELMFVFPCVKKVDSAEKWRATSFVYLDRMARPHLMTRAKGQDLCEYTRFRAEANAVVVRTAPGFSALVSKPTPVEYPSDDEATNDAESDSVEPKREAPQTMSEAIEAIRLEDYDGAIVFFSKLVEQRPNYHIGWLRLGHALREKSLRTVSGDGADSQGLLKDSINALERATEHRDPEYQARAHYELSKAFYHATRILDDEIKYRDSMWVEAQRAAAISQEKKFSTWLEHLEHFGPRQGGEDTGALPEKAGS